MKRCPSCERTYTDDALSFCPNDGTPLVTDTPSSFDPQATIMATPPKVSGPFDQPSGGTDWPSQPPPSVNDWSTPQPPAQQSGWGGGTPAPGSYTPGSQMTGGQGWQAPPPPPFPGAAQKQQGLAIGSLVCGILSVICCLGFLTGIPAVILGVMAMNKEKADPATYGGRGLALAGVITGGIGILFGTIGLIMNILPLLMR